MEKGSTVYSHGMIRLKNKFYPFKNPFNAFAHCLNSSENNVFFFYLYCICIVLHNVFVLL